MRDSVNRRIDGLEASLTQRINSVEASLTQRMGSMQRFMEAEFKRIDQRIDQADPPLIRK